MAGSSSTTLSPPSHSSLLPFSTYLSPNPYQKTIFSLYFHQSRKNPHLQFSRRPPNYPREGSRSNDLANDPWGQRTEEYADDDMDDDDEEEEEEEDRSLDLLVRFVQNVFKKVSKKAKRAVRSVLPVSISRNLVGFSVNGVIILAFLWVLKAFLEVVCTLGSVVFVSILLIRGVWSGVSYLQESRKYRDSFHDGDQTWNGAQSAS